jgi:hypothetical protein
MIQEQSFPSPVRSFEDGLQRSCISMRDSQSLTDFGGFGGLKGGGRKSRR